MTDVSAAPPPRPLRELLPNLIWEAVLLLIAIGVTIALYTVNDNVFGRGAAWSTLSWMGFAAVGLALSFRTGTPNLAVGQLVSLTGWVYASSGSMLLAVLAALGFGLVAGLLAGLTGLPAWAVTFAGGMVVQALLVSQARNGTVRVEDYSRPESYWIWAIAFALVSIAGAVVFAIPAVRRFLSANRADGGEAGAFSGAKLVGALVGITGSSLLAAVAGLLQTRYLGAAVPYDTGLLVFAFGAVLLGAVSPFGRRAGILGVVLGTVVVDFLYQIVQLKGGGAWVPVLIAGICALVGLLVIWLIELIGRRVSPFVVAPAPAAAVAPAAFAPPAAPVAPFGGYAPPVPVGQPYAPPPIPGQPAPPPAFGQPFAQPVSGAPLPPPGPGMPPLAPPAPGTPPVSGPPVSPPPPGGPAWPPAPAPQ
ncbi:hypothetical protein [Dactylosporangium sp. CA-139066]|uniref:hypothetical protein n=1 Tax=Dactylosporangium sp. CA-139066 TaxID=3239930 RepID=UPI003D8B25C1